MAEGPVTEERLFAGKEYLDALADLGFRPDAALWTASAGDDARPGIELSLVSSLVERVGPREIYELLFKAYDSSGTPKTIDPWMVTLYGSETRFADELQRQTDTILSDMVLEFDDGRRISQVPMRGVVNRVFFPEWVYIRRFSKPNVARDLRALKKFRANVEHLAA